MSQKNNSLYELSVQLAIGQDEIVNDEGVISPELEAELDRLLPAITDRAANLGRWLRNIDGNIEAVESEIARLKKRKEVNDHLKDRLKAYLKDSMEKAGMDKIDTGIMVLAIQKNPPSVELIDETIIPASYKDIIPEQYVISKKRILEALKAGEEVKGAVLHQGTHLRLR